MTENLTLLTDFYQLNMMYAHYKLGNLKKKVVFDLFFRSIPCQNGYAIAAGLEQAVEYIKSLHFTDEDLTYLRKVGHYDDGFLKLLSNFRFTGDLWAIPEGTFVFPHEPLIRVEATILEAHLLETALLNIINHQTLIATKAARVVHAAGTDPVLEFGLRRAQGPDAGVYGARATYIAGVSSTSNVLAGKKFGIPISGTNSHAYVLSFGNELDSFRSYLETFPDQAVLVVDTYDTLYSGVPHAITAFKELFARLGREPKSYGIRLDSGDLAYLSKETRKKLDEAGFKSAKIFASGDLDENLIRDLKMQGAKIDAWGVGTHLITSKDCPSLGGVYKLSAEEEDGVYQPRIKVSENPDKITNPGVKKVVRFISEETGKALADLIMLADEENPKGNYEIFHPIYTMKRKWLRHYRIEELLLPIFRQGELVYSLPTLEEIRKRVTEQGKMFAPEILRLTNPHEYHVDLSKKLWDLKNELIQKAKRERE
ncbi:MAG: nicotinate phosphoribosyltransferase [Thermicanus sp.]|nr:nicotinate phosphoribosyltransferase [Thermicanus sp.]